MRRNLIVLSSLDDLVLSCKRRSSVSNWSSVLRELLIVVVVVWRARVSNRAQVSVPVSCLSSLCLLLKKLLLVLLKLGLFSL